MLGSPPSNTTLQSARIKRTTLSILTLPALPTLTAKLLELVDKPRSSSQNVSRLIEKDQVLTARLLKLANSAFYGFPRKVATIQHAVVLLGFNSVRELCLSFSLFDVFKDKTAVRVLDMARFWQHALAVGVAAKRIANRVHPESAGEAFVAGLLHDIGKVVLSQYFPNEFNTIRQNLNSPGLRRAIDIEEATIGTNHAQVGSWLLERWNLPIKLVEAVAMHHCSELSVDGNNLALLVQIADFWAHRLKLGHSGYPESQSPNPSEAEIMLARLSLDLSSLDGQQGELLTEYQEACDILLT